MSNEFEADLYLARNKAVDQLELTVSAIQDKKDQIKRLTEEIENLFASLPEASKVDDYPAGRYILRIRENRRFNEGQAQKVLSPDRLASIKTLKVDTALARRKLSGEEYESCQIVVGLVRNIDPVIDDE